MLVAVEENKNMPVAHLGVSSEEKLGGPDGIMEFQRQETLLKTGALQDAIFNSANFSSIATDARGVIQIFNVGAERMLGYPASEVVNQITPADISDPQELIARASALSLEFDTPIMPGFEALVFKASRGIEDHYELNYVRKDGAHFPATVSVTALRDASEKIIGYLLIGTDNSARKLVEEAKTLLDQRLRDQQFYTRSLIESNIDALMTTDPQGIISDVNHQMIALTGRTRDELIGAPCKNFFTDPQRADAAIKRVLAENTISNYELTVRAQDGKETVVSYNAATFHDRDRTLQGVFAAARDVTERKAGEQKIQRQSRLYAALSQCNKAIVHCASEEELFPKVCHVAVESGFIKMAWIGLIDGATLMVRPVASFGEGIEDLQDIEISADMNSSFGRGPTGMSISESQPYWCQDFLNDPATAPWHERAARHGWAALASLPLRRGGVVIGSFVLYSGDAYPFDEDARHLLDEMAADISFALDNFAREAQRKRAEDGMRAAEEQFRGLVEQSIAGIYIIQDGKFVYMNERNAEIVGQGSSEELIGSDSLLWIDAADRAMVGDNMRRLLVGDAQSVAMEFRVLRHDGVAIQVGANAARATHMGRPAVIGLLQDISEKKRAKEEILRYDAQLKTAFMSTVEVATIISEMRDPYTAGHERRVAEIAVAIGAELGFDAHRQEGLQVAGHLHDIGKITIPSEILSKPGKLSPIEYQLVQGHVQASFDVLKGVEFPWPVAQIALQHHERMDGSGYPQGLKGEAILLEARIMAVADVVEAMSSHRPYRPGLGIESALAEIERGRGSAYDVAVADACLQLFREKRYQLPA